MSHLTDKTLSLAISSAGGSDSTRSVHSTDMSVRQEVVTQQWSVGQCLDDTVHEARVAQVDQPSQSYTHRQVCHTHRR